MRDAFLAVLGALALTCPSTIQQVAGTPIATRHCPKECVTFLTRPIPQSKLQKYEKSTCGKAAVILTTKKNLVFCANPKDDWVQLTMHLLDEKNAPPSPTVDESISEKRVMLHGTAIPTTAQVGDTTGATETVGPAHYGTTLFSLMRMGMSSMSTGSSAGSSPQPEVDTHQPEILVNGNMISSITDGPKTLVEDLMPVGKGLEELTGLTAFGGASETPSLTEANRYLFPKSSGTLPNSHQESVIEKSQAAETTSHMPEVLVTTILSSYRTHFITVAALGGILCISAVAWAFAKLGICTTSSPTEMVQGLLISPSKFQTNACAADIL